MTVKSGITLLDGAIGTSLWNLAEAHGIEKVPVFRYNIEHPELLRELYAQYLAAGSKILLGNTFGANGPVVRRASSYQPADIVRAGMRLTCEAVRGTDAKAALSVGPLTALLEPYGDLTAAEAQEQYEEQIGAGMDEHPDCICLQTFMDREMMKIAADVALRYHVPVYATMSFEARGRTMMGQSVDDILETLGSLPLAGIGLNCSLGPAEALPVIREFSEKTDLPLVFKPNAGKPKTSEDGKTVMPYTAEQFAEEVEPALEFVSFVGGCCGTDPSYIRRLHDLIER